MSLLGAVVRVLPEHVGLVRPRLDCLPGLEVALDSLDGRLVLLIEDVEVDARLQEAAATLDGIARWPEVLNTSLVYEYSGPDVPTRIL